MMKANFLALAGATGGLALMVTDDPAIAAVQAELERALPMIKGAQASIEGIVGGPVGAQTVLIALFIVFCGRGLLTIADKLLTFYLEERRAARVERQRVADSDRAYAQGQTTRAQEIAATGLRSGAIRPLGRMG